MLQLQTIFTEVLEGFAVLGEESAFANMLRVDLIYLGSFHEGIDQVIHVFMRFTAKRIDKLLRSDKLMLLSVGDILQLSRLAADLYTKGWAVARDAPQDFRDLVHELLLLKDILFLLHKKVSRDPESYGDPTKRVLQYCIDALSEFSTLVGKYEKLALSDRGHWFRRLQWSREQDSIRDCRQKLQKYQALLQLVLTPDGRTILCEEQPEDAKHGDSSNSSSLVNEDHYFHRERAESSLGQPTRSKTIDSSQTLISPYPSPYRIHDRSSPLWPPRPTAPYYDPESAGLAPLQKTSTQVTGRSSVSDNRRGSENLRSNQVVTKRPSDTSIEGRLRQMSLSSIASEDSPPRSSTENATLQPLEIPEPREQHHCPEEVGKAFLQSFGSIGDEVIDESWIRIATWWLLKASSAVYLRSASTTNRPAGTDNFHLYSHWEDTTSENQAYADLLKSSWIVEELIRKRKVAGDLSKRQARKLVIDLLKALKTDLHRRQHERYSRIVPETAVLLKQDLSLLETFEQTVEAKENVPQAMDDLTTSQRWITIDQDHGGFADERVMFRCWVNAQIGQRHERSKSSNAPYVVLLWTKAGESEISVSLCNQRDTLNLSRKLTVEDLEDWESLDEDATTLHLDFPSQPAEINFLAVWHFQKFREGPVRFFNAVKGRDPQSGELTIFQTVLQSYRNANASSVLEASESDTEQRSFDSCELRVYERMDEMCWKTVRRLVVSSAADSKRLGSVSHWLPISNVRLQVEDSTVTVSWSDCGHLEKKSQGNYNPYYSYVYRSDQPNQKVILVFHHSDVAQRFEDCILRLTETPPQIRLASGVENLSAFQDTRLYSLFDQDDPDRGYHGIVHSRKSPKTYHCSQVAYVYRDLDFTFLNQDPTAITLHNVRIPHYLSNRHKMLARPKEREVLPQFREVTCLSQPFELTFSCDEDAVKFLSGLTGWRLKFYRQCARLVMTDTSRFGNPQKTYKNAEIQLWEKAGPEGGNLTQLIARLNEEDKPWLTGRLDISGGGLGLPSGGVAELKGLAVQLGKDLDIKHMKANVEGEAKLKSCWKLTITFKEKGETVADSENFMVNTGLLTPFTQNLGFGLGLGPSTSRDFSLKSASMNPKAESEPSSWNGLYDEIEQPAYVPRRRSTETQVGNIFASSDEPRSDAHRDLLSNYKALSKKTTSRDAISLGRRENELGTGQHQENNPQLPLVSSTGDEVIHNEAEVTGAVMGTNPGPSSRDVGHNLKPSEPRYRSDSSTRSTSLASTFWDEPNQSKKSSSITISVDQIVDPDLLIDARSKLLAEQLDKWQENQMGLTTGKALDDEESTKSVLGELQTKSHLVSNMTYTSNNDTTTHRTRQPDPLEPYKQPDFAGKENRVIGKSRKRLKSGCLNPLSALKKTKSFDIPLQKEPVAHDAVTANASPSNLNSMPVLADNRNHPASLKGRSSQQLDPVSPSDPSKGDKYTTPAGRIGNGSDTSLAASAITSSVVTAYEEVKRGIEDLEPLETFQDKRLEQTSPSLDSTYRPETSKAPTEYHREVVVLPQETKSQRSEVEGPTHTQAQALTNPSPNSIGARSSTGQPLSQSQGLQSGHSLSKLEPTDPDLDNLPPNRHRTPHWTPWSWRARYFSILARFLWPEVAVAPGKTRFRWNCSCGTQPYDDFIETRAGAAEELRIALHLPNRHNPEQRRPSASQSTSSSSGYPSQAPAIDLGTGLTGGSESTSLFTELRQLYHQLKKEWWHRLSLKVVTSIRFVQSELHQHDLVDVRKVPDMPPQARNEEYLYQPCELLPPIGENLMTHLFHHPHEANEKAITFLRSPKKLKQRLVACPQMGASVGWGVHLVEGWAVTKVWVLALVVFLLSSLVFAVAWSVLQHDVQGAFGVAAYFVALVGLGVGTLQAYINKS
ncbi:MAG: hypothetical protein Q9216_005691 [Gyalolechia sp. 2 TL-2023]